MQTYILDTYHYSNMIILYCLLRNIYKNDNAAFHRSSAVAVLLYCELFVSGSLNIK